VKRRLRRSVFAAIIFLFSFGTAFAGQNVAYRVTATALIRQDDGSFAERAVGNIHLVAGDRLRYDVVAANLSDAPQLLNLKLKLPPNVDFISTTDPKHAEYNVKAQIVSWHGQILESQTSAQMQLTFRVATGEAFRKPDAPKNAPAPKNAQPAATPGPAAAAAAQASEVLDELPTIQLSVDDIELQPADDTAPAFGPPRLEAARSKPSADPWGDVSRTFAVLLLMILIAFGFSVVLKVSSSGNNYSALDKLDRPMFVMPELASVREVFRRTS
jgi:hypothetical protein